MAAAMQDASRSEGSENMWVNEATMIYIVIEDLQLYIYAGA